MGWNVYLHGNLIDTVWFQATMDAASVRRSLIDHDGFDPDIVVRAL